MTVFVDAINLAETLTCITVDQPLLSPFKSIRDTIDKEHWVLQLLKFSFFEGRIIQLISQKYINHI